MSGIDNFGMNCWCNAIIQMLRYTRSIVKPLVAVHPTDPLLSAFVNMLYQDSGDIRTLLKMLPTIGLNPLMQNDSHEFMLQILDKLYETEHIKNPFKGNLIATLDCPECHWSSTTTQPFVSLSIDGKSVKEGVEAYCAPENLGTCEKCSATTVRTINIEFGDAICIHLKRFNGERKLNYNVVIEETFKDFSLRSMCNHFGSRMSGHYTAWARTDGGWYLFNDEYVTGMDGLPKLSPLPYIMVYERKK